MYGVGVTSNVTEIIVRKFRQKRSAGSNDEMMGPTDRHDHSECSSRKRIFPLKARE
jgi:hypothetical protein